MIDTVFIDQAKSRLVEIFGFRSNRYRDLLHELAVAQIVIPFPTAVEIQRDG